MPSRFNNIYDNNYVSTYVPLPFEEMAALGQMKQKQQDLAAEERAQILGKTWNRLPGDASRSQAIKQEIDQTLSEYSDKDFNDPQVRANWYKTKVDLVNRFGPNGEIGSQEANFNAYKEYEKELLSKSKELGWSQDELRGHLDQAKNEFFTRNEDGSFNNFQGKGVANYVDENDWASKVLKDVADDTGITQLRKYGSLNEVTDAFVHGELNHKDYNKIMNSLAMRAQGDTKLRASLEQQGNFRGQQGWSNFIKGQDKDGNIIPDTNTPFGKILAGIAQGAQFQKQKQEYIKALDPWELWKLKKGAEDEEVQRQMQFSIQGVPVDPNNPTNTDAGINQALRSGDNPLAKYWELKDGKLSMRGSDGWDKESIIIDGKEYDPIAEMLPLGYSYDGPGRVKDISGKIIPTKIIGHTDNDQFEAYKNLAQVASRLGIKGNREQVTAAVEKYLTTAHNFQMNFPKFDEGTINALSKANGVIMKEVGGESVIANPGQLAFSTMKTLDGKPIAEDNLVAGNATRLNNARLLGPAQSLTNKNYEAGDMYVQSGDGNVYIINTNNRTVNNALEPTTKLTQSINNFVNTGKREISKEDENRIRSVFPDYNIVGEVGDKHGNQYYSFINTDNRGETRMGVIKVGSDGTPYPAMDLSEATKQITETNMKDILPTYNPKNYDRVSKVGDLDTEDTE